MSQAKADLTKQPPRAPHTGAFRSLEQLDDYNHAQLDIAEAMRRRLADRQSEIDFLPRHRQWAGRILIRAQERDPRVTPTMLDDAKEALVGWSRLVDSLTKPLEPDQNHEQQEIAA